MSVFFHNQGFVLAMSRQTGDTTSKDFTQLVNKSINRELICSYQQYSVNSFIK